MIYTIILDHEKSKEFTNSLISNIGDHPYEVIESSKLNTSFTESFNIGFIKGYKSKFDHIMICNNDISLSSQDLDMLNERLEGKVGIFSPSLNSPHAKVMSPIGSDTLREVYWVEFVAPIFHREVVQKVGVLDFDMSYGWGIELDYCYRSLLKQYNTYLVQDVQIRHYEHQSQEDQSSYRHHANMEMNHVLAAKYGSGWQELLRYPQW